QLQTMTGVVKQTDFGAAQAVAEIADRLVERRLVEIDLRAVANQREAEILQRLCHQAGVAFGIGEAWNEAVLRIADDQRDAILGGGRKARHREREQRRQEQGFEDSHGRLHCRKEAIQSISESMYVTKIIFGQPPSRTQMTRHPMAVGGLLELWHF